MRLSPPPVPAPLVPYVTPPPLSGWTWINQGPYDNPTDYPVLVTAQDIPGGLRFQVPGPTNFPALIVSGDPLPEPPYTITLCLNTGLFPYAAELYIATYNSGTGEGIYNGVLGNGAGGFVTSAASSFTIVDNVFNYTSDIAADGESQDLYTSDLLWLRIQYDGTEIHLFSSSNGVAFLELGKVASIDFLSNADRCGLMFYNYHGAVTDHGAPYLEAYKWDYGAGRLVVDLLSVEVVPYIVDETSFPVAR